MQSRSIPLIRAGALIPLLRWAQAHGRPMAAWLEEAGLSYFPHHDPELPIPLIPVTTCFRNVARIEGPDVGCRIVSENSVRDLAMLGRVALGVPTPRMALCRVAAALPFHCTHEHITIKATPAGSVVNETWSTPLDDETLHITQQYVAALIQTLCRPSGSRTTPFVQIALVAHPEQGLDHLRSWFGLALAPSRDRSLEIVIPDGIADRAYRSGGRDRPSPEPHPTGAVLGADGSLATSARIVTAAMLQAGVPTAEHLAQAARLSLRTLQRRLAHEGTTVSQVIDDVRRDQALAELAAGRLSVGAISSTLGYGGQAAFTRAVRRWTGSSPRSLYRPSK